MAVEVDGQENADIQAELTRLEALWRSDEPNQDRHLTTAEAATETQNLLARCQAIVEEIGGEEEIKDFNGKLSRRVTAAITDSQGFRWKFKLNSDLKVDPDKDIYEEGVEFASVHRSSPLIPRPRNPDPDYETKIIYLSPISRISESVEVTQTRGKTPSHTVKYEYKIHPSSGSAMGDGIENTERALRHANSFLAKAPVVGRE